MGIRQKMLLPMIALALFSVAAVLVMGALMFSSFVDSTISNEIDVLGNLLEEQYEKLESQSVTVSSTISNDQEIITAMQAGDQKAMLSRAQQLVADGEMDFSCITDAQGNVLARSHEPDNFGDNIADQDGVIAAMSGKSLTTVEEGKIVQMSIRSAFPIYGADGSLIGTVVAGKRLDTEAFVDEMKELLGAEITVFKGDTRISTTVVDASGNRAVGTQASTEIANQVFNTKQNYFGKAQVVGHDAFVEYMPIVDANTNVIGMLFIGKFLDVKTQVVMDFILKSAAIALGILAIGIVAGLILSKRTVQPIKELVKVAERLSVGDMDVDVDINTKDETRFLADAFRKIIASNRARADAIESIAAGDMSISVQPRSDKDVVGKALVSMLDTNNNVYTRIKEAANMVSAEANQVSNGAQSLAQNNTEQAASVEQFSHSIAEISDKTHQSSEMADKAAALGDGIRDKAEQGSRQMDHMMEAVREINEASQSISKVIKVIDDIAFQTNILALNAAVEAARAGQHGKGFAVVADEVRNLAAKSAEAASDTGVLIANSMEKAALGSQIAEETARSLNEIVEGITQSGEMVDKIAEYSSQQTTAIESVNESVGQVSQVVQDTSALAEETAASSEQLSSQSQLLNQLIGRFKLRDDMDGGMMAAQADPIEIDFDDEPVFVPDEGYDLL